MKSNDLPQQVPELSKREELIEFLNFKQYNTNERTIKDILEEFQNVKHRDIPTSTAYRIVKKWNDEQKQMRDKALNTEISDKLLQIFQS